MSSAAAGTSRRLTRPAVVGLFAAAFLVRLLFGVTNDFWGDDEFQVYLIGLQFYTTGIWPLYGPDVVYTHTQVPGGLQGLLVGGPLWIVQEPEAPYALLNVLSFAALLLLGWYVARRQPDVPRWWLWSWMFFSPWTLNMSAHVVNTSYVMIGAIVYTISALELVPATRAGIVRRALAWFGLGFGVLWVYQEHLSAALLALLAAVVFVVAWREDARGARRGIGWAALGGVVAGATLLPTVLAAGAGGVAARTGANLVFEPANLLRFPQVAAQFFSFASLELPRFIGGNTDERLAFLARFWWAAPFVVAGAIVGVVQAAVLAIGLVVPRVESPQERGVRRATAIALGAVAASFVFSVRRPASHAFYIAMPLVVIYAFSWWERLLRWSWCRRVAVAVLIASAVAHVAIARRNFTDRSLYRDRALVVRAIQEKNYRLLGERRPDIWRLEREVR
ncbi:MAG: hypothetical protein IT184_08110 [Acidobacteria bacterium]|nr:hypothetical protein [Acidobacteriota bacterium]